MGHFSQKAPVGFMTFASDMTKIPDGNISVIGGDEYLIPFEV